MSGYLNPEAVVETWGADFAPLVTDSKIKFADEYIEIELSRPMKTGEGDATTIKIHEPTVGDMKWTDGAPGEIAKAAILLRVLSGVPQAAIDKMRGSDFIRCNRVVSVFLGSGQ